MLLLLLHVLLLPLLSNAEVLEKISLGQSLTKEDGCKFNFEKSGREYNLCPLFSRSGRAQGSFTWDDRTPPTKSKTKIRWNFAGPLERIEGRKESDQCPKGTWICMKVTNRKLVDPPEVPPRITKLIPIAGELEASSKHEDHEGHADEDIIEEDTKIDITASLETTWWAKDESVLHLRLHGGTYVQKPQHAVFTMRCDHEVDESPTYPFSGPWNGTHYFSWRTKHACFNGQVTPKPGHNDAGKGKNDDDTEKLPNDEGDSFVSAPRISTGWKVTTWVFACLLLGGLIFHLARTDRLPIKRIYPALRTFAMYHPLAPLYRRFTFRVGETGFGILRWARRRAGYESVGRDQMLFDSELDETGDWINGRTGSDEDRTVVGDDEVLPVTSPSPRKSSFGIKSYGTR